MRNVVVRLELETRGSEGRKTRDIELRTYASEDIIKLSFGGKYETEEGSGDWREMQYCTVMYKLVDILDGHKVRFTKPQQKVVDRLLEGYKLCNVTPNAMAGTYEWMRPSDGECEYAGSVYKAFWNVAWAVFKQTGLRAHMTAHIATLG